MFTKDELFSLEYAVANLIQDKRDYCTNEEDVADDIERLEELQAKVQGTIRKLSE
jgi:formiminotetrahydrofolate cyclodeaminase